MKVIITGPTGFIGKEVLSQCLSHRSITSIIALSRRELPISDPKLKTIIHSDFTSYPPELLSQLAGAEVCIYALGIASDANPELNTRVNVDFTLATARAFADSVAPQMVKEGKSFRLIYTSGHYVETDPNRSLWVMAEARKRRGKVDLQLEQMGREIEGFEVVIVKPSFVLAKDAFLMRVVIGTLVKTIRLDRLAAAMVDIGVKGSEKVVWGNDELAKKGRQARGEA